MSDPLFFEHTMKMFLGKNADQIASAANNNNSKERRSFYRKAIKKIKKQINNLDTTLEHRSCLFRLCDSLKQEMKGADNPTWKMIDICLMLYRQFLGHTVITTKHICNLSKPIYSRDENQYYTDMVIQDKSDADALYKQIKEDAISARARLVQQLISEGFDHFNVAIILNISEYQVKKLKSTFSQ